jgi:hypothetical protein
MKHPLASKGPRSGKILEKLKHKALKWTAEESLQLILDNKAYKNKWAHYSEKLKGRTTNDKKNRFYSIFRKVKTQILKNDYTFSNDLELLEIHHVISILPKYLASQDQNAQANRKRGKDYIYTLILGLSLAHVQEYVAEFTRLTKSQGSFAEITARLRDSLMAKSPKQNPLIPEPSHRTSTDRLVSTDEELGFDRPLYDRKFNAIEAWESSPLFPLSSQDNPYTKSPVSLSAGPAELARQASEAPVFNSGRYPHESFSEAASRFRSGISATSESAFQLPENSSQNYRTPLPIRYSSFRQDLYAIPSQFQPTALFPQSGALHYNKEIRYTKN